MTQQRSDNIFDQIQQDALGMRKARYSTTNPLLGGGRFLIFVPVFLLLSFLVGYRLFYLGGRSWFEFHVLLLLFTILFLWLAWFLGRIGLSRLLATRMVVSVHERGMVIRTGRLLGPQTFTVISWDQISHVSSQFRSSPLYTIHLTDGRHFLLRNDLKHLEALVSTIEQEVARSNDAL
jgi:hypothetical protein